MDPLAPTPDDAPGDPRVERALAREMLLPLPPSLVRDVVALLRREPAAPWERPTVPVLVMPRWARAIAAALLVAIGAAFTLADVEPVSAAAHALAVPTPPALSLPTIHAPTADWDGSIDPRAFAERAATSVGAGTLVAGGVLLVGLAGLGARLASSGRGGRR